MANDPYCPVCFRPLSFEDSICVCTAASGMTVGWTTLLPGVLGLILVVAGILSLSGRLCLLGAGIGAVALLVHVARLVGID